MANVIQITETEFIVCCEPGEMGTFEIIRFGEKKGRKLKNTSW